MNAAIVTIGSEIVAGVLLDRNSQRLTVLLGELGIAVTSHLSVGDDPDAMRRALSFDAAALILCTGGLGPTEDDRTREVIASLTGRPLERDERDFERIRAMFARFGRRMAASNERQAFFPQGATLLVNHHGTASGFAVEHEGRVLLALPGVPREIEGLWPDMVAPFLKARFGGLGVCRTRLLHCFGPSEARLGEQIADMMEESPSRSIGTLAQDGVITVRLTLRGADERALDLELRGLETELRARLGDAVFGCEGQSLAHALLAEAATRQLGIATAESCTGGLLASMITDVAGASAVFKGGVVAYSNAAKTALLGVADPLIAEFGAVSAPVAEAMAQGAAQRLGADLGLATTGIAGPSAGNSDKPVGLCFVAAYFRGAGAHRRLHMPFDRVTNKDRFAKNALDLALRRIRRSEARTGDE